MRVRNTHPNRPLMCSGLHLQPGVWREVSAHFALQHRGVPDLEFEEPAPDPVAGGMSLNVWAGSPAETTSVASTIAERESPTQPTGRPEPDEELVDVADGQAAPPLREWAQENGWPELKDGRRRVPPEAQAAYEAAFPS